MRDVWLRPQAMEKFQKMEGKENFHFGCPNFYSHYGDDHKVFNNFLWNTPLDDLTFSSTFFVQLLRNRIEGQTAFYEIFPFHSSHAVSYRVVNTRNCDVWIDWHQDWYDKTNLTDKRKYLLSRVQATLFLAKHGVDYDGDGLLFENNQGEMLVIGKDVEIEPGDLMIWRYNNLHSVRNIIVGEEQLGFLRILYPPELHHYVPLGPIPVESKVPQMEPAETIRNSGMRALASRMKNFIIGA